MKEIYINALKTGIYNFLKESLDVSLIRDPMISAGEYIRVSKKLGVDIHGEPLKENTENETVVSM